ncbi:MAG: protease modulator HflC [Candidatus Omnitrophica bacterium]|nr:protease modulator HflC [Candidatus Omnitrophota bacterium]
MKPIRLILLLLLLGAIGFLSSAFVVTETEQAFLTEFGKPIGKSIAQPGIKFKVPFIQVVHSFDKRFLEWDGHPNQVPTRDKRYISIDTYARWRIHDPLLFFQKVQDETGAQTRLDDILDGVTRNAIANHDLVDVVRSQQRDDRIATASEAGEALDTLSSFSYGRDKITKVILANASPQLSSLGIELLDLRFKRLNYEEDVKKKIFERMISERKRIADKYRSEGQGEAAKISGEKERELKSIESEAFRQSQEIKGKADAEAAAIYAAAYDQKPSAREFYRFSRTMETYEKVFSTNDWFIFTTSSEFYHYLQKANP